MNNLRRNANTYDVRVRYNVHPFSLYTMRARAKAVLSIFEVLGLKQNHIFAVLKVYFLSCDDVFLLVATN